MVESLMDASSGPAEGARSTLDDTDVTRILAENGYSEVAEEDVKTEEIPLSMKVAVATGIMATGAGLIAGKVRSKR